MKRAAPHRSPSESASLLSPIILAVAVELSHLCTNAAQLHNAIGNQHYLCHHNIPSSTSTLPTEDGPSDAVVEAAHAHPTQAMQHYQLASEMLLLAEEYRDPSSSACAALVDINAVTGVENQDDGTTIGQNAEASLNFMLDFIADFEAEHNRCVLMAASTTTASSMSSSQQQGTPLSFTLSTSPKEQAAAVFYNMSLVCVLLGNEDRAVDFLAMVEELCLEDSTSASSGQQQGEEGEMQHLPSTPAASPPPCTGHCASVELLALSVVSSARASPPHTPAGSHAQCSPPHTPAGSHVQSSTIVEVVDTGTLLQIGKSHAIRSKNFDSLPSSVCSVPTVLPSYHKDPFGFAGGGVGSSRTDGNSGTDAEDDDGLSQASEPCLSRSTV